jgi:hypothetical protein
MVPPPFRCHLRARHQQHIVERLRRTRKLRLDGVTADRQLTLLAAVRCVISAVVRGATAMR